MCRRPCCSCSSCVYPRRPSGRRPRSSDRDVRRWRTGVLQSHAPHAQEQLTRRGAVPKACWGIQSGPLYPSAPQPPLGRSRQFGGIRARGPVLNALLIRGVVGARGQVLAHLVSESQAAPPGSTASMRAALRTSRRVPLNTYIRWAPCDVQEGHGRTVSTKAPRPRLTGFRDRPATEALDHLFERRDRKPLETSCPPSDHDAQPRIPQSRPGTGLGRGLRRGWRRAESGLRCAGPWLSPCDDVTTAVPITRAHRGKDECGPAHALSAAHEAPMKSGGVEAAESPRIISAIAELMIRTGFRSSP
jgi:hypothetical protein